MKKCLLLIFVVATVLMIASCRENHQTSVEQMAQDEKESKFDSLVTIALKSKDEHLLPIIDSNEAAGELSSARADFVRGLTYDRARHIKVAERYYAKAYENVDPEEEGWDFYLSAADRLSQIRMSMNDQKGAISVATEMLDRAEKAGKLTDIWKIGFLWSIALCQSQLGMEEAEQNIQQVYALLEKQAKESGNKTSVNLLIFTYVLFENNINYKDYAEAEKWLKKADDMLKELTHPGDSAVVREYTSLLSMAKVQLLEGQGKEEQAYAFFRKSLPLIIISPECSWQAANYLLKKGKYDEAADLYNYIDKSLPADYKDSEMNLDNIGSHLIPRLRANLGAGRKDSVIAISRRIAENYAQALNDEREDNAAELATIYDTHGKAMQITEQQAAMSKQRSIAVLVVLTLLLAFFIIYTWYSRRAANRLGEAHVKLQNAYFKLEETTAAKERIESELRIARDIQMSMVPGIFPEYDGLDMSADMTPAKEVGGDLYGYVIQSDCLYFCVGDVSGKGVPASLFMAQATRLFCTLSREGFSPEAIANRMNSSLCEGNDTMMFVTMFIGMLNLQTGHLDFCNCGHNPPIISGEFLKLNFKNRPIGILDGVSFQGESIDDIRGQQMLIYTDGLNEAENQEKEQLGNDHLLELMADTANLTSYQVIDKLKEAVEQHRAGAAPNDDLTLMCLKLS